MTDAKHTPGPWDYVRGNEHHGPYVTTDYGTTVADLYVLSEPGVFSTTEARTPIPFMHEMAEANARLIASAPCLLEALTVLYADYKALADSGDAGNWQLEDTDSGKLALAAIAKATGEAA